MRFLVDRNIPLCREAFASLGEVSALETTDFTPAAVRDADAIVIRSETRVDGSLLEGSRVRFVGSATIGTDHVDLDYLAARGIAFACAPGCNANSVKEYVVAALLHLAGTRELSLPGKTIGVVGVGHVGSRVVAAAQALGLRVLENDPPLARQTGDPRFVPLGALLDADIVTLHVPLTRSGTDPTYHLFDERLLARLRDDAVFINTSRGAVVETGALIRWLRRGTRRSAVLDVWEDEPRIDTGLLETAALGTPHVAGYSLEGKLNAVRIVRAAACRFAGTVTTWEPPADLPVPPPLDLRRVDAAPERLLGEAVRHAYDIAEDDRNLRRIIGLPPADRARHFRALRTGYRVRREFTAVRVLAGPQAPVAALAALGFSLQIIP